MIQEKSKETRRMIENSAIEIMLKKGYAKTTLEDIVKNINMTRGAFYWHFKNKRALLEEIEKKYEQNYLKDYSEFEILDSAYETLEMLIDHQIKKIFTDEYIKIAYLFRYRIESLTELPELMKKQHKIDLYSIKKIEEQVIRGIELGEFDDRISPKNEAMIIFSFIVGVENTRMLHMDDSEFNYDKYKLAPKKFLDLIKKK